MPEQKPITGAEIEELEYLDSLTRSKGWRYIRNLLHSHHLHCEQVAHTHLEKHEDRKAGEWLARSKEPSTILNMIVKRKNDLSKKRKEG